jgi:hypothetical protein
VSKSISLALPLVLLPHVAQKLWLHRLLQRGQHRGRPAPRQHRRAPLLDGLVADDGLLLDLRVHIERDQLAVQRPEHPGMVPRQSLKVAKLAALPPLDLGPAGRLALSVKHGDPLHETSVRGRLAEERLDVPRHEVGLAGLPAVEPMALLKPALRIWVGIGHKRKDIYLIAINGSSTWMGPGGLRLGLSLSDLEKLNRKPFKLRGFDKDNAIAVIDWEGGALTALPGGCKAGVTLNAQAKAPAEVLAVLPADREVSSADAALRAVRPAVTEILIGY